MARRGGGNVGIGVGEGKKKKAEIWTAACAWRQLAALFHDSHRVPSHTDRTRAGTRLLPTPPDLSDISDRAVKDS